MEGQGCWMRKSKVLAGANFEGTQEFERKGSLISQVMNPGFRSFWEDGT